MSPLYERAKVLEDNEYMAQAVADCIGIHLRTLQDRCKRGLLDFPGQGTGNRRKFNIYDIIIAAVCEIFAKAGLKTEAIKKIVNYYHSDKYIRIKHSLRTVSFWDTFQVSDDNEQVSIFVNVDLYRIAEKIVNQMESK